jgi:hypothetical protein
LIHTVVCTDVNHSVDWQCRLLEYTWKRAAQSGELLRLVTCAPDVTLPSHTHARVCRMDPQPEQTMGYKAFERLFALEQWLERERPRGTVLILDPDCVFRRAIHHPVEAGAPRAQHWVDYRCASDLTQAATWPMLIDAGGSLGEPPRPMSRARPGHRTFNHEIRFRLVPAVCHGSCVDFAPSPAAKNCSRTA